jgi:hypothetical protein
MNALRILVLFLSGCTSAWADDSIARFSGNAPDVLIQAAIGPEQLGRALNETRAFLQDQGRGDPLSGPIRLQPIAMVERGISLEDYMDRKLVRVIQEAIGFSLKQISTSLEVYRMTYRAGVPQLRLKASSVEGDELSLTLGFEVRSLDIDVEHLTLSHHSPGVRVQPADEEGQVRIEGQEHMTLIDDIYVRLMSPEDLPLISIVSPAGKVPVVSGEITVRVRQEAGGSMRLAFGGHRVDFFGGGSVQSLSEGLAIHLGSRSRIGGLDAIEFGKSEFRFKNDISGLVQQKKLMLVDLLAGQAKTGLMGPRVEQALRLALDSVEVGGSRYLRFARAGPFQELAFTPRLNQLGVLDSGSDRPQLRVGTDHSLIWMNNAFLVPDALPFPLADGEKLEQGLSAIDLQIREGRADAVVGLNQDFINEALFVATRGWIDLPQTGDARADDWIRPGRSGVFLMLDRGEEKFGRLVVDLEVKPSFFPSIGLMLATLKRKLRFPVVIRPEISVVDGEGGPELSLKIQDFDLSEETLRNGVDGVPSNLNRGINRKWLINKIRKVLAPSIGKEIKRIPLGMLQGMKIAPMTELKSDGMGRLNLWLKFEDGLDTPGGAWGKLLARLLR